MAKDNTSSLNKLEQNFRELIIERCKFCGFDKYLEENPNFEFPKIAENILKPNTQNFITIPGMFGSFTYYLEEVDGKPVLYAEQSSRMDHDSNDYLYFEITESGSRVLESEERETVRKRFCELAKKAHERHLQKLETMKRKSDLEI